MEMTEAATTPVVAASRAPTSTTASAKPPRMGPNTWPMVSSRSSAMPLRSRTRPIRVKNGIASMVSLVMMPKMRSGNACIRAGGRMPSSMPRKPKNRPQAPRLNATGKPSSRKAIRPPNMIGAKLERMKSMVSGSGIRLSGGREPARHSGWYAGHQAVPARRPGFRPACQRGPECGPGGRQNA